MTRASLLVFLFYAGTATVSFGQSPDSVRRERKINHFVGVQANELVRQVFNFNSNNASSINNPYLLTYSINSVRSGWGARVGIGYTYRSFTDEDPVTSTESVINDVNVRLGVEKAFRLSSRATAGIGIDALWNSDYNKTKTVAMVSDTTITLIKSDVSSLGGGAMGWIRYELSSRVLLGTEASFYYVSGDQSQTIEITRRNFNGGFLGPYETRTSKIENKEAEGVFRLPVAIYLVLKF